MSRSLRETIVPGTQPQTTIRPPARQPVVPTVNTPEGGCSICAELRRPEIGPATVTCSYCGAKVCSNHSFAPPAPLNSMDRLAQVRIASKRKCRNCYQQNSNF